MLQQKMILNFDATLAKATDVVAVNLMATALGNQKTPLLNHVSEKAATIQNASRRMLPVNPRVAREAENLAKMKTPPQKHQKMILNFDATLAAKATDVVAANLMATALGNQKTPPLNHVSEKAATIQNVNRRMLLVNPRVARETANLEKMKTPPQKLQKKMILNFDATFAKMVAAVNLMATALGNQKTPLPNHVSAKAATIQHGSLSMSPVNPRVAREAESLAKMKTPPQKHQKKTILNFDAILAKATEVEAAVNLMATALGNQKTPLLNHVSEKAATIQNASRRMLPVN